LRLIGLDVKSKASGVEVPPVPATVLALMTACLVQKEYRFGARVLTCALLLAALVAGGCGSVPSAKESLKPVAAAVTERAGPEVQFAWAQSADEQAAIDDRVNTLLREPLNLDSAVQIAVLKSPSLRIALAEIQLSQADILAASRLANPTLTASLRWPNSRPRGPDAEFSFAADLLNGLLIPLRRHWAEREVAGAQARMADEMVRLITDVKKALVTFEAHQLLHARIVDVLAADAATAELAQRQFEAGNINQLDQLNQESAAQEAQLALLADEQSIREDREALTRLLGLRDDHWRVEETLSAPPALSFLAGDVLIGQALQQRLDLKAARQAVENARAALDLKKRTRWLPASIETGIDTERESPGDRLTGPTLSFALPIFNQGQDEVLRLTAEVSREKARADSLEIAIASDVRVARARVQTAAQMVSFYTSTLLPQRHQIVRETLLHYNAMQKSSYEVLAAKQQELAAQREEIEALRQYWLARADLERAVGSAKLLTDPAASRP